MCSHSLARGSLLIAPRGRQDDCHYPILWVGGQAQRSTVTGHGLHSWWGPEIFSPSPLLFPQPSERSLKTPLDFHLTHCLATVPQGQYGQSGSLNGWATNPRTAHTSLLMIKEYLAQKMCNTLQGTLSTRIAQNLSRAKCRCSQSSSFPL